jgi:hypothetical protein
MNFRFTVVETSLNQAEFRWKWLRFLRQSLVLGIVLSLLVLLLGGAILTGWVTSRPVAVTLYALIGAAGFVAWAVILISAFAGSTARPWLAAALERVDRRLLDRLNTLVFLEKRPSEARAESFARRIARQTQFVLAEKASPRPFAGSRPLGHFLVFILSLTATVLLYELYPPWDQLALAAKMAKATKAVPPDKPFDLAMPATNNVEQNQAWGEVRITDPGTDLRVTKVDVVPLQIEAAANQALNKVDWFSTINGTDEAAHELPPPSEPRYAVYQPTVYLDELNLSDWDVMTYYAKASTDKRDSYASEVYFLEVRPFREDIMKLPGGENGECYHFLNALSALITRQQHVIRQTHQHIQRPPESESVQAQDRKKLSEAEADLSDSTQHLYAKLSGEMENKPIGEALDNLAKAEQSLDRASKLLQDNVMNDARNRERSALSELVAARKTFQKAVSDNPKAFDEPKDEEQTPVADPSKKLNEMAEFRDESKAAQEFVRKTLEQQKELERQTRSTPRSDYRNLANQEQQLQKGLENFQQQHPRPFNGAQSESEQAEQAMSQAAEALRQKSNNLRAATKEATQQLQRLSEAMKGKAADQQLADAYKLKQMLDQQIEKLDQRSKPDSGISDEEMQKAIEAERKTLDQLKSTAEQDPTRDAFGPALREALANPNRADLEAQLKRLEQAQSESEKQQRAGEARDGSSKVSKAFAESEPKSLQMAQQSDSLKPGEDQSFAQGMAELDSLIKQMETNRQVSPQDKAKQGRQALADLQTGIRSRHGNNDRGNSLMLRLDQMLKGETPLEVANLKKLMDELQNFSVETADQLAKKEEKPELTNIDPAHLPPAYRGRIQKYFQKLSEK